MDRRGFVAGIAPAPLAARGAPEAKAIRAMLAPLFWDRDLRAADLGRHPDWVLARVLTSGTLEQARAARAFYGDEAVLRAVRRRGVDSRTRNYWRLVVEGGSADAPQGRRRTRLAHRPPTGRGGLRRRPGAGGIHRPRTKIVAIGGRGGRRDFVDLYFYLRDGGSLEEALGLVERRFAALDYNAYHLLRALVFFEDAEAEPMPRMLRRARWSEIRNAVVGELRRLA